MLREPWGQPKGSERDDQENSSTHIALFNPDKTAVAVGRVQLNTPDEAQVRFMAVDSDYQNKGFGRIVLTAVENAASQLGARYVILQAREKAVPFYISCGYHHVEKTFLLYGSIQHYLMKKQLG